MAEPFIGEIKMVAFDFAPRDWAICDGQLLPISQNQTLYSLLGTTFGGDGMTTFALPDLRGRVPVHTDDSAGISQGRRGGPEAVLLNPDTMPAHTHPVQASTNEADQRDPTGGILASTSEEDREIYGPATNLVPMKPAAVTSVGGGQPHDNMQPYLTVNFCISLTGTYPQRS